MKTKDSKKRPLAVILLLLSLTGCATGGGLCVMDLPCGNVKRVPITSPPGPGCYQLFWSDTKHNWLWEKCECKEQR